MAQRKGISSGTTAQRSIEEAGKMRFNTTNNLMEYYDGTQWKSIDSPPVVSSISPSNLLSGDGTGNHTIVVTGSGFSSSVTAVLITDGGTEITPDTTTRDSSSQVTLVVAKNKANLTNANEPFDIKITNSSGLSGTLADALNIDASPVFSTAAGSLATVLNGSRSGFTTTILAADPESGGDVVYSLESGTLPAGASLASQSSGCVISGNLTAVGSNTTSNFTIRAKDAASNTTDRAFSITVNAPAIETFTSNGTFSVPSGVSTVDLLVVAGGGGGGTGNPGSGHGGGGGGAGGLVYRPAFPVTPGGTVSVIVGAGGPGRNGPSGPYTYTSNYNGNDSIFGTITAKGGGGGGSRAVGHPNGEHGGHPGGSGGGGSSPTQPGDRAAATQPTQSGESGNYGFGNNGGIAPNPDAAAGGGGAGAVGSDNPNAYVGGAGGVGKAYSISGSPVYYAGGGGGGGNNTGGQSAGGSGAQGGGGPGGAASGASNETQQPGTANRGGGGGGTGPVSAPGYSSGGGAGGKGVVIVQY